jgi:DnaK suppressor protein
MGLGKRTSRCAVIRWHVTVGKKGERAMPKTKALTPEELRTYKERLLQMRARLRGEVYQVADAVLGKSRTQGGGEYSAAPTHPAEVGAENYEQEFAISLIAAQNDVLEQIEIALERIEEGTYGICEECGCQIPRVRLNAVPYATMCVKCAEKFEEGD